MSVDGVLTAVEPLRFHDLRSSFRMWARRAGKSDAWISERTGHELSGGMISRYDRGATMLEDLAFAPFPGIADALPELSKAARLATRLATGGNGGSGGRGESEMISDALLVGARGFVRAPFQGAAIHARPWKKKGFGGQRLRQEGTTSDTK